MKKLIRKRNSKFAGVCSGIADYLGIDESIVRAIFIVSIFTPIPITFTYLILWIIIPKEPKY
jgi:phage shock protein PspC (stress-responsive transcriptional regulator)